MVTLPPTAVALLRALVEAGGALPYHGAGVTTSGLTALRHAGIASVQAGKPAMVRLVVSMNEAETLLNRKDRP